jgi:hypothetical protein
MDEDVRLEGRAWGPWVVTALVAAGAAAGAWYYWTHHGEELPKPVADPDAGAIVDAGPSLSLADGDALLRKLAASWTKDEKLLSWLGAEGIVQRLTAAVRLIARGESPRPVLSFIEIRDDFAVRETTVRSGKSKARGKRSKVVEHIFIAPKSYARYDGVTRLLTAIDPDAAAKGWVELRPYFETAFAQVASPGEHFEDLLGAACKRLLSVKLIEGQVELVPKGAIYAFKDPALESLPEADKHMLRMGPSNGKAIQDWIRRFAASASLRVDKG